MVSSACSTIRVDGIDIPNSVFRKWFRKLGQLWYEIFDFSTNVGHEDAVKMLNYSDDHQLILAMHPHGIVPFHALLWAAFGDQYFTDEKRELYGFGAVADVVMYMPFLRNIMGYLSGGSATYKVLRKGLVEVRLPFDAIFFLMFTYFHFLFQGKVTSVRTRTPKNLYILPGGIAEIFTSKPGRHAIVFKDRRGLCKLSVETGAEMVPCYVFGGTDFFENLATNDSFSWLTNTRKFRMGITLFWGYFGLPIPYAPKVTMVIGDPIPVPKVPDDDEKKSKAIDLLHATFLKEMEALFEKYKAAAGYPDAKLEIL